MGIPLYHLAAMLAIMILVNVDDHLQLKATAHAFGITYCMSFWAAGLPMGVIDQMPKYENDSPGHGLSKSERI